MSTALVASPRNMFSNYYLVTRDEESVAELDLAYFSDHCELEVDGDNYHIRRDCTFKKSFSLE